MKKEKAIKLLKKIGTFIGLTYAVFFATVGIKRLTYAWIALVGEYVHSLSISSMVSSSKAYVILEHFTIPFDNMVLFMVYLIPAVLLTFVANKVAKKYIKDEKLYKRVRLGYSVLLLLSLYVI